MNWLKRVVTVVLGALLAGVSPLAVSADDHPEIVEFWLVDAMTDLRIQKLEDYSSLRLPMLPAHLSIEAVAAGSTDSVRMEIDGAQSSLENLEPYALRGDASGDFNPAPELRTPGWINISAQPFAGPDATGVAGAEEVLHLYLHQPDFVVRNPADIGDYDPGDGYCSITAVPHIATELAVVPPRQLEEWELELRADAPALSEASIEQRSKSLLGTIEIDDQASSKPVRHAAEQTNHRAMTQIKELTQPEPQLLAKVGEPIPAEIPKREGPSHELDKRYRGGNPESDDQQLILKDLNRGPTLMSTFDRFPDREWMGPIEELIPTWYPLTGCTLRAAVEEANALSGRQSILIDSTKGPFELTQGHITISGGVDLIGYGHRSRIETNGWSRIFYVTGDHIVNMRSLDLAKGNPGVTERGGAMWIDNDALVQMSDSIVRENQANFGGGIYLQNGGDLTLTSSAVRDNIAGTPEDGITGGGITQRGGGIFNLRGNVKIRHSAIFDNLAVRGGGLSNFGGTVRVENSSVIDNEALAIGGGIENHHTPERRGNLHLAFATVAYNAAGTSYAPPDSHRVGGGLYNTGWAYMASSILARNTDGWSAGDPLHAPDCYSPTTYDFKSYRNNVVGVLNGNCDLGDYSSGSSAWFAHGTEGSPLDPEMFGKTAADHRHYRMIRTSSPALDSGASASASLYPCPDHDSRGRPRPVGAGCDSGAVERQ